MAIKCLILTNYDILAYYDNFLGNGGGTVFSFAEGSLWTNDSLSAQTFLGNVLFPAVFQSSNSFNNIPQTLDER